MVDETTALGQDTVSGAFSDSYAEARAAFLAVAEVRDAAVISTVHPTERGAQGEDLAIDIAVFGEANAEKSLLLVSGTHGQEAFLGSALQIEFLRSVQIPAGINIVAVHALNPWGFSHLSRTDEANIDLNRNFGDFGKPVLDDLYPMLFEALCPDDWTEETVDWSGVREQVTREHGVQRMVTALAGGQSAEPRGLTYTGTAPSWSRNVVADVLPRVLGSVKKVAFIEWHTGLGEYGELSHMCQLEPGSEGYDRAFAWMGDTARAPFADTSDISQGKSPSYSGMFTSWLPTTVPDAQWAGFLIEVGTVDNLTVQDSVRIDWWLKFGRGESYMTRDDMRHTMMEALNPTAPAWRAKAMRNGLDAQLRALRGLEQW